MIEMSLSNRTENEVNVFIRQGILVFPPSGVVARPPATIPVPTEGIAGCPCVTPPEFSKLEGIEGEEAILVSALVAPFAAKVRPHVYSADTGPGSAFFDKDGYLIGVKRLIRWS